MIWKNEKESPLQKEREGYRMCGHLSFGEKETKKTQRKLQRDRNDFHDEKEALQDEREG